MRGDIHALAFIVSGLGFSSRAARPGGRAEPRAPPGNDPPGGTAGGVSRQLDNADYDRAEIHLKTSDENDGMQARAARLTAPLPMIVLSRLPGREFCVDARGRTRHGARPRARADPPNRQPPTRPPGLTARANGAVARVRRSAPGALGGGSGSPRPVEARRRAAPLRARAPRARILHHARQRSPLTARANGAGARVRRSAGLGGGFGSPRLVGALPARSGRARARVAASSFGVARGSPTKSVSALHVRRPRATST